MAKLNISVCMGSSCFARGNNENLEFIEKYIKDNHLEAEIDITGTRCEGKCATGPNIFVNGIEYSEVDIDKIQNILAEAAQIK